MVTPREEFLGAITLLDKDGTGTITCYNAELDDVNGVIHNGLAAAPTTGADKGSFWVGDGTPTVPKFTDSAGTTFTLGTTGASALSVVLDVGNETGENWIEIEDGYGLRGQALGSSFDIETLSLGSISSGNIRVRTGSQNTVDSGSLSLYTGGSNTTGDSGNASLYTGGSNSGGVSGSLSLTTGSSNSGNSGSLTMGTGSGSSTGSSGLAYLYTGGGNSVDSGLIRMETGGGNSTGESGLVYLGTGGGNGTDSGLVKIYSGGGNATDSGSITLETGSGNSAGASGGIALTTGAGNGTYSGDIALTTGASSGTLSGSISLTTGAGGASGAGDITMETGIGGATDPAGDITMITSHSGALRAGNMTIDLGNSISNDGISPFGGGIFSVKAVDANNTSYLAGNIELTAGSHTAMASGSDLGGQVNLNTGGDGYSTLRVGIFKTVSLFEHIDPDGDIYSQGWLPPDQAGETAIFRRYGALVFWDDTNSVYTEITERVMPTL